MKNKIYLTIGLLFIIILFIANLLPDIVDILENLKVIPPQREDAWEKLFRSVVENLNNIFPHSVFEISELVLFILCVLSVLLSFEESDLIDNSVIAFLISCIMVTKKVVYWHQFTSTNIVLHTVMWISLFVFSMYIDFKRETFKNLSLFISLFFSVIILFVSIRFALSYQFWFGVLFFVLSIGVFGFELRLRLTHLYYAKLDKWINFLYSIVLIGTSGFLFYKNESILASISFVFSIVFLIIVLKVRGKNTNLTSQKITNLFTR